jgi:hypothetical protein
MGIKTQESGKKILEAKPTVLLYDNLKVDNT